MNILILGAGYAGLAATTNLAGRLRRRDDVRITLVNAEERFTERLRLHMTAAGRATAELSIPELLKDSRVRFVRGRVTGLADGVASVDGEPLPYDKLVFALGSAVEAPDHTYTLNSWTEARALPQRLTGPVVVCGSGLTGVEAAAEIAEAHPGVPVTLIGREAPGASMSVKARAHLTAALTRLGVRVLSGVTVDKVLPDSVVLDDGTPVPSDYTLWTAGVQASPLAARAGFTVDDHGRIVTDESLRSVSHPDVYAVGDAAHIRQRYGVMHGTCQGGMPTGVHAAMSIARELDGKRPKRFRFGYFHMPVSLGRGDAVVQFTRPDDSPRRAYLSGRAAVRYKETVTASPWPTFRRMLRMPRSASFWTHGGRYTR
ncbi:oxidoreductase [Paractinoplanes deccanensis]|uniref:Oxidoreductase n=1 Tax=Paractinoplanes deccanensis TaxID=113561 RepID=A0ABQ3Y7P0_9ACTN|nr:FAD-dependent oxidoreductase [Actinoplanes deccanensis]GID76017.1 oxidoreductase [Actinoplanes deccanensis]